MNGLVAGLPLEEIIKIFFIIILSTLWIPLMLYKFIDDLEKERSDK